jgi:hypothetical protein
MLCGGAAATQHFIAAFSNAPRQVIFKKENPTFKEDCADLPRNPP